MPVPVLSPLDFSRTELLNARLQNLGADPTGLGAGDKGLMWIDNAGVIKFWDGSSTKELGLATGGNAETLDGEDGTFYLARANHTGTQPASTVSDFDEAVDDRVSTLIVAGNQATVAYDDVAGALTVGVNEAGLDADTLDGVEAAAFELVSNKGAANGYAGLDTNGLVPANQLPALALTDVNVVADIAARDALDVQEGDVAIVTSTGETFIYDGAVWQEMSAPTDGVTAVSGAAPISSTGGATPEISLDDLGVSTGKIANLAVTADKLADGSVDLAGNKTTGVLPVADGGTGASDVPSARAALGATGKHTEDIGDGAATELVVTHNLGTRAVAVDVFRNSTPWDSVLVDIERTTINTVTVRFATAPAANAFTAVVVG